MRDVRPGRIPTPAKMRPVGLSPSDRIQRDEPEPRTETTARSSALGHRSSAPEPRQRLQRGVKVVRSSALLNRLEATKTLRGQFNETLAFMKDQDIEPPGAEAAVEILDIAGEPPSAQRRWRTLLVVSAAQLLVILDGTIVNIALPSAQSALGMSDASRQWAVTAYALAFGGLLLIGGRVSSALGHRRTFMIGLVGFAVSSALGGAAVNPELFFGARALQGAFATVLAPAGLSLLSTTFTEPRERGRAFGVFAAVGAAGSALGLVAGGLLTEYATWRWCLYINVPVALLALLGTTRVQPDRPIRSDGPLDVAGALLSASGLAAVVYACNEAEPLGWHSPKVLALLTGETLLLAVFAIVEVRTPHPLLPMRVLLHRARAGALIAITLISSPCSASTCS